MPNTQDKSPHVAMVPTPGLGHLIPLVEFAKRLVLQHHFSITILIPTNGTPPKAQKAILEGLPDAISAIFLPPVSLEDLPENVALETRIPLTLIRSLPSLRGSFKVLAESTRLVAWVVDLFGLAAFDVAKEFGVSSYIFLPLSAMVSSFILYLPELDETSSCEYRDLPEPVELPGCVPIHGRDMVDPVQDRKSEVYKGILQLAKGYPRAAGIIVNSFLDLEPGCFKALAEEKRGWPPIYPVGPLVVSGSGTGSPDHECLQWLDEQPKGSVLFVSFGSGGTLSHEQLHELAVGLEASGQRFLWVVRSPHEKAANATFFTAQSIVDPFDFLPQGFLERTKGVGLVVSSWAPQVQILKHDSTGGFLTHCGWNSSLESIVNGVPLIAWPLFGEQRMNAVLLADDLKVAVRVKVNDKGLVENRDIANYARGLIEGEEGKLLRSKMKELQGAAERALSPEGPSTKSLAEVAQIWKSHQD